MMIKKIVFILIMTNIGLVQAQYTAIPDFCFEFQLIDLGIDSEGIQDGQILTSDVVNVIGLDASPIFCNINDLTGIEDFIALEILYCSFNNLTELDISQNLQLRELYCSDNNLTSIDVSTNILLEKLVCPTNELNTLISSNDNINLDFLQISNNSLVSLNISNFINLRILGIHNNNLSNLDISNLENLEGLGCANNSIISLDLTTNVLLERINCVDNQELTFIDIRNGNNTIITNFNVTNSQNLTCIFVDNATYSIENWLDIDENSTFVETEVECKVLVLNDNVINNISVYPNPVKDILYLENFKTINEVKIYSILGRLILSLENISNQIDLSNLNKGTWFLKIETESGNVTKKIIKM